MIKAVLFDYDGVVVNSMPYHIEAWRKVFNEYYVVIAPEDILLTEGRRSIEVVRKIFKDRGLEASEDVLQRIVRKKQHYYREITEAKVQSGLREFIERLKRQGLRIGLVTGSARANVERILCPAMLSQFDVVVTGDDLCEGKPNPEAYLKAARALAIPPQECLVIENAPLGIQAAKNAAMRVVALTTTLDRQFLQGADAIVKDLTELAAKWETFKNG